MEYTSVVYPSDTTLYNFKNPCWRLLGHWLKCIVKSFSKFLSQVQIKNVASSNSLLPLKVALENKIMFRSCQVDHVTTNHQYCHLLTLMPSTWAYVCWRKWCFGFKGKAPLILIQDMVSHHIGWILMQWMNKWDASSSTLLQKGHDISMICTCLQRKIFFVGSLSLNNLHANIAILLGIFIFHSSSKQSSWLPAVASSQNKR